MKIPEPVSIMTASLAPGDAIGNYILTLQRLLEKKGIEVQLFADHIEPQYGAVARSTEAYCAGKGTLWYHYSIFAENLTKITQPAEFKIIDYHGVSPPALFQGYDPHLAYLCERGLNELPTYNQIFDVSIVHSEYTRQELLELGFRNVTKLPLVVDTSRFSDEKEENLSMWLQKLTYLLFVGRIVPQKDILAMLEIFKYVHAARPNAVLVLVGSRHLAARYQREIDRRIRHHQLSKRVLFTGQINDTRMLASLYKHARFTLVTSEWESFCVPIVESMTFATPLIVHDIPPLPEVMGNAGIVIDKHQPEIAAMAIDELWSHRDQYTKVVQQCQQRSQAFTERALASDLVTLLDGVSADG
jgi:L-malate glycosyltransferase